MYYTSCFSSIDVIVTGILTEGSASQSNFAVDSRSFLEALKGESIEEAMGGAGEASYEESYGGYSSRDQEQEDNTTPPSLPALQGRSYGSSLSFGDSSEWAMI